MSKDSKIRDIDRDSLHTLPLSINPFQTTALRHARLIKNSHLNAVVEFFRGRRTGSGQVEVNDIPSDFDWEDGDFHPDQILLLKLAPLPSYDVYSLRILFREHGIPVNQVEDLKLSDKKVKELTGYMRGFTHPLIVEIYGRDDMSIQNFEDVIALFRDPDVKKTREKLKIMAEKIDIDIGDLPKFLEDYGDIFLSLSYYRQCLDYIDPTIANFIYSLKEIRGNRQLSGDQALLKTCDMMERTVTGLQHSLNRRFRTFDRSTRDMWNEISAERFRQVEALISNYHTTIGGILCALTVKMSAWARLFPSPESGGPVRRAEFIMNEMRQGVDTMRNIERSAPKLEDLAAPKTD